MLPWASGAKVPARMVAIAGQSVAWSEKMRDSHFSSASLSFAKQSLSPFPSLRTQSHFSHQLHHFLILHSTQIHIQQTNRTHIKHFSSLSDTLSVSVFSISYTKHRDSNHFIKKFKSFHPNPPVLNFDFSKLPQLCHTKKSTSIVRCFYFYK